MRFSLATGWTAHCAINMGYRGIEMTVYKHIFATTACCALVLGSVAPAAAAPIIGHGASGWTLANDTAQQWRGNGRGYGYGGGYGRGYRHRDRIDGGDILAGILIIGGIAAIASAASKNARDNRGYENQTSRYPDNQRNDDYSRNSSNEMQSAIGVCADAAEQRAGRNARVEAISSVTRDQDGWRVEGNLSGATQNSFVCSATNGRVDFIQLDDRDIAYRD